MKHKYTNLNIVRGVIMATPKTPPTPTPTPSPTLDLCSTMIRDLEAQVYAIATMPDKANFEPQLQTILASLEELYGYMYRQFTGQP